MPHLKRFPQVPRLAADVHQLKFLQGRGARRDEDHAWEDVIQRQTPQTQRQGEDLCKVFKGLTR